MQPKSTVQSNSWRELLTWHRARSRRWWTCFHAQGRHRSHAPSAAYSSTPRGPFDQKTSCK